MTVTMTRLWAVAVLVLGVGTAVGCTKQNPALCCISDADCDAVGVPRETGCAPGLACKNNGCIQPECAVDTECPAETSVCSLGVCVECDAAHGCGPAEPACQLAVNGNNTCAGCTASADCDTFADTTACDTTTGSCVACVVSADCPGATPVCEGQACRTCVVHSDCDSNACLPEGTCGTDVDTAFVDPAGTANASCTQALPCNTIAAALATNRPNMKLRGTIEEDIGIIGPRQLTIVADPGTILRRSTPGNSVLSIEGNQTVHLVRIYDLTISGGSSGVAVSGVGGSVLLQRVAILDNTGVGVSGTAEIRDSVIANNGLGINGASIIVNNIVARNGTANAATGGMSLGNPAVVEFNTIADNLGTSPNESGVRCFGATFRNNIVSGNGASCVAEFSLFNNGSVVSGTNRAGDPRFKDTNQVNPRGPNFYRIGPQSAALDGADPASSLATDIDGDPRPQGPGRDIGADELKP